MPKSSSPKKKSKEKSPKKNSKEKSPKKGSDKSSKKDKSPKTVELSPEEIEKAPITHVIFDLDGVLLDSVRSFDLFINKLIAPYEKHVPRAVQLKIKDKKLEKIAKIIVKELGLPMTSQEFINYYNEWLPETLMSVEVLPGASKLLRYFKRHQIPIAVVTDSSEELYNHKILRHKPLFEKLSHAVCYGSDPEANRGKPFPYIYQIAASRFTDNKPKGPYNILVFEDTEDGVDAALAAGMKVVWVPDTRIDASLHNFNKNLMVIDNLLNFKPELWKMPGISKLYTI